MASTSPLPFKITRMDDDLGCWRRHTIGFSIVCPRCGERKIARTKALARTWLYAHCCQQVNE